MPFDGIVTHTVTNDLSEMLTGGKINKIHQPTATEMMISVRNNGENHALLLSIHPSYARVHLTKEKLKNPAEPPMFCMVMRKHIQSAVISDIKQMDMDRIIAIHLNAVNEIGDRTEKTLYIEIMGRHSNIVLINEQNKKIIDCMKHIPPFQNRYRSLLPGANYIQPPSQNKLDLRQNKATSIVKKLDFNAGKLDQQLTSIIAGISRVVGKEIVHRVRLGGADAYEKQMETLQDVLHKGSFYPTIYDDGTKEDFHVVHLTHLTKHKQFGDVHEMLDAFYRDKATRDRVKQQMKDLIRLITNELKKNNRKLAIHEKTLQKADKKEVFRKKGELLTANLHTVKRGDNEVIVIDYYDPEQKEITITLDTEKMPSDNAQSFFKKYRKLSAAEAMAAKEIAKTKQEITYLEDLLVQIDHARDEDLEDIRTELQDEGYIKKQKKKKKRATKPMPERFTADDGTPIYVGRNNKQNEYVTHKLAHKNDMWLHTLDIPGSHIIIKSNEPTEATIQQAAVLAAYYSKAKDSASVPIDYTQVRYVKKPSGAKPGFVTYSNQKTIYATPTEAQIETLRANNKMEANT